MCLVNHWGRVNSYHRRKTKRLYCLYIYLSERPLTKKEWIDNLALTLYSWGPEGIIVLNISCNRKLLYSMILGGLISDTKVLSKVVYLLNIVKYHVFLFVKLSDLSVWKKTFFFFPSKSTPGFLWYWMSYKEQDYRLCTIVCSKENITYWQQINSLLLIFLFLSL